MSSVAAKPFTSIITGKRIETTACCRVIDFMNMEAYFTPLEPDKRKSGRIGAVARPAEAWTPRISHLSSGVALSQRTTSYANTQRHVTHWFKQEPLVDYLRPCRVYSWSAPRESVIGQLSIVIFCLDFGEEWLGRREETRMAQAAADAFRERLAHGSGGTDYQPRQEESRLCPYAQRLEQDRTGQRLTTTR